MHVTCYGCECAILSKPWSVKKKKNYKHKGKKILNYKLLECGMYREWFITFVMRRMVSAL